MGCFFCLCVCVLFGCFGVLCVFCVVVAVVFGSFVSLLFLKEFQELEPMPLSVGHVVVGTEVGGCDCCVTLTCEQVPQLR